MQELIRLGNLRSEKCELKEAAEAFSAALDLAKKKKDVGATCEAIARLLRLASEALDEKSVEKWELELDELISAHPKKIPAMAWYCKGVIAGQHEEWSLAQRHLHHYLKAVRDEAAAPNPLVTREEAIARAWTMIANTFAQRGHGRRSKTLAEWALKTYEEKNLRGINGILFLQMGWLALRTRDSVQAQNWFKKAHGSFLAEHNWYYHLYALYGYACVARMEQNYPQAYWYLELMEKAATGPEFGVLKRQIQLERQRLEQDAVDIVIDGRKGVIKTREAGAISLGKQYVLLNILEELSVAHSHLGADSERGLSKAEIIERVWKERYRPEAHDNKLYYNINRLRKLIEPDVKQPQYLQNWKEGYRLAPGLKVHVVGSVRASRQGGKVS